MLSWENVVFQRLDSCMHKLIRIESKKAGVVSTKASKSGKKGQIEIIVGTINPHLIGHLSKPLIREHGFEIFPSRRTVRHPSSERVRSGHALPGSQAARWSLRRANVSCAMGSLSAISCVVVLYRSKRAKETSCPLMSSSCSKPSFSKASIICPVTKLNIRSAIGCRLCASWDSIWIKASRCQDHLVISRR